MRVQSAEEIVAALFNPELKPNLPAGKAEPAPPSESTAPPVPTVSSAPAL